MAHDHDDLGIDPDVALIDLNVSQITDTIRDVRRKLVQLGKLDPSDRRVQPHLRALFLSCDLRAYRDIFPDDPRTIGASPAVAERYEAEVRAFQEVSERLLRKLRRHGVLPPG